MATERIVNMDDPMAKAQFLNSLRALKGMWRFTVVQFRQRRTDRQNRYYWPCFVHEFGEYLRDQGMDKTDLDCHEILKMKFLRQTFVDPETGEAIDYTRSTTKLDTREFNEYLDKCAAWLSEFFGIIIPEPDVYHEPLGKAA